jgi:hypothetical protein
MNTSDQYVVDRIKLTGESRKLRSQGGGNETCLYEERPKMHGAIAPCTTSSYQNLFIQHGYYREKRAPLFA